MQRGSAILSIDEPEFDRLPHDPALLLEKLCLAAWNRQKATHVGALSPRETKRTWNRDALFSSLVPCLDAPLYTGMRIGLEPTGVSNAQNRPDRPGRFVEASPPFARKAPRKLSSRGGSSRALERCPGLRAAGCVSGRFGRAPKRRHEPSSPNHPRGLKTIFKNSDLALVA